MGPKELERRVTMCQLLHIRESVAKDVWDQLIRGLARVAHPGFDACTSRCQAVKGGSE